MRRFMGWMITGEEQQYLIRNKIELQKFSALIYQKGMEGCQDTRAKTDQQHLINGRKLICVQTGSFKWCQVPRMVI